jgi:hypothetical protein
MGILVLSSPIYIMSWRTRLMKAVGPAYRNVVWRQRQRCLRVSWPLEGVIVVTFPTSRLCLKTLHHHSLDNGGALRCDLSGGIIVEPRYLSVSLCCHWWSSSDPVSKHFRAGNGRYRQPPIICAWCSYHLSRNSYSARRIGDQSERAGVGLEALQRELGGCGVMSGDFTRMRGGTSS